ncbi:MAG: class I SAM-dependent methyltransferase [Flavobacteriales bacterium]|nr:class I SAM-dependent methyltransferase [Flavobacteriales bacterium]
MLSKEVDKENAIEWHSRIATTFDQYYHEKDGFKERLNVWNNLLDKYSNSNFTAFDVGCGSGALILPIASRNKQVVAIEGSDKMLTISQEKVKEAQLNNVDFVQCDLNTDTIETSEKADLVICSSVLEYVDDIERVLSTLSALMNKDGTLIISMPNKQSLYRRLEPISFKLIKKPAYYGIVKYVYKRIPFEALLSNLGFTIIESRYFAPTAIVSPFFRSIGMPQFSDNLFITVARLKA